MATRVFEENQIISRNSEEDRGRNISVKFHQNPLSSFRAMTYACWSTASGAKNL